MDPSMGILESSAPTGSSGEIRLSIWVSSLLLGLRSSLSSAVSPPPPPPGSPVGALKGKKRAQEDPVNVIMVQQQRGVAPSRFPERVGDGSDEGG